MASVKLCCMRVLLADDHPIVRMGIKRAIEESYPDAEIMEAFNADDLERMALEGHFDLILSDISMPGQDFTVTLKNIRKKLSKTPFIVLSVHDPELYAARLIKLGVSAYLTKDCSVAELTKAIEYVLKGKKYITNYIADMLADNMQTSHEELHHQLTDREFEIFKMIVSGKPNAVISQQLSVKEATICCTKSKIKRKMNIRSNADLVRYAIDNHIID